MIRKSLIETIVDAASIERWNDHIRPSRGFTELDKQAHKMVYAYTLGKINKNTDWRKLIEGGIFEFSSPAFADRYKTSWYIIN